MTKEQKGQQTAELKARLAAEKAEKKRIATLPKEEKAVAMSAIKQQKADQRAKLKAMPKGEEKTARKREERRYKRLRNRPRTIAIWASVLALILVPLGSQIILALLPDSAAVAQSKVESRQMAEMI